MKPSSQLSAKPYSAGDLLAQLFVYLKYLRLMSLLMCLGLTLGMTYYVYAQSVYYSRSLVKVQFYSLPNHPEASQATLASTLGSNYMIERTALRIGLTKSLGSAESLRDSVIKQVDIRPVDEATMRIDVWSTSKDVIRKWPQAMVDEFFEYSAKQRMENRERAVKVYTSELQSLRKRMDQQADERFSFESENSITEAFIKQNELTQVPREIILAKHRISLMERVQGSLAVTTDVSQKLTILSACERELDVRPGVIPNDPSGVMPATANPGAPSKDQTIYIVPPTEDLSAWQRLDTERRQVKTQLDEAAKTYLPGHPVMAKLLKEMERLDQALDAELGGSLQRFNTELERQKGVLVSLEEQLPEYREIIRKYDNFKREFALQNSGSLPWEKAYEELSKRITGMEYAGDQDLAKVDFMGFTVLREDPVSPAKMQLVYISIVLGAALALAVPFGLEYFNDTIAKVESMEANLNLPGLGIIPFYPKEDLENISRMPDDDAEVPDRLLENFRIIRSAIAMNKETTMGTHVIMISSARPQEGKTIMSYNLSWSFASIGEKTLLIDTDLRRGRLHKVLNVDNSKGVSTILNGQHHWTEAVTQTKVPNLYVLTRGPIIAGSTEKLCSEPFDELMATFRQEFARIIVDTPPVLGLSESSTLQRVVDGVLLVVMAEKTAQRDVQKAQEVLRKSGAKFYGFVLNRLDLRKVANYYNYYTYSSYYYTTLDDSGKVVNRV